MTFLTLILFISLIGWTAWKIYRVWPAIIAAAKAQADMMDDMNPIDAAKFALLGHAPRSKDE